MGGTTDDGQTMGQDTPEDLMTVWEVAQAVGRTPSVVHGWIRQRRLPVQPGADVRLVSLAAVRALCAPRDPQAPPEAFLVYDVARAVGLPKGRIRSWAERGLLPSWQSHHGLLVRVADVRAVAEQRAVMVTITQAASPAPTEPRWVAPPLPAATLSVRDAARLSGLSRERLYLWMKKGLLPVWLAPGRGRRVRLADVVALAERPERALPRKPVAEP